MKERIIQIMRSAGMSNADFAEKIGISTSSLSHIFSGRNNPSLDMVKRLHKSFPAISLNWIMYGEGDMYEADSKNKPDDEAGSRNPENGIEDFTSVNSENPENPGYGQFYIDFRKEKPSESVVQLVQQTEKEQIRYIEKPTPKITEIRIFFDNGTFEVFKPENK